MAPITLTETSLIEEPVRTAERTEYFKLTNNNIENRFASSNGNKCKASVYDEIKLNDPSYFKPVREWEKRMGFLTPIRWGKTIIISAFHIIAVVWFLYFFSTVDKIPWKTVMFGFVVGQIAGFGVTAGVHRYWSHRSYKAKRPLEWILLISYSVAGQIPIYDWVRDHRVHHKFSETHADPHNAHRGFFFSHVGWLMMKKHPDVIREGKKMDMSDIINDPLIQFHTKYFHLFKVAFCWVLPSLVPAYFWGECWEASIMSQAVVRYFMSLNFTWSVNSFAHLWGNKPYDVNIMPSENWGVSLVAMGEGWHNYHHTFPWDYKAAELGISLNVTTTILNFFEKIGWAYDMKQASPSLVQAVVKSRGVHRDIH